MFFCVSFVIFSNLLVRRRFVQKAWALCSFAWLSHSFAFTPLILAMLNTFLGWVSDTHIARTQNHAIMTTGVSVSCASGIHTQNICIMSIRWLYQGLILTTRQSAVHLLLNISALWYELLSKLIARGSDQLSWFVINYSTAQLSKCHSNIGSHMWLNALLITRRRYVY